MIDPKQYPVEVRPLSAEEGGGWFATFPDLDGCHGDGDTPSEAIEDGYRAAEAWLRVAEEVGDPIPQPSGEDASDLVLARIPRTLHASLRARASREGVGVDALIGVLLSEDRVGPGRLG